MSERKHASGYTYMSFTQRLQMESLLKAGVSKSQIAKIINVHIATVYREIKRGLFKRLVRTTDYRNRPVKYYVTEYCADKAQKNFKTGQTKKGRPIKLGKDYKFVKYVVKRIAVDKLSPLAVIGELRRNGNPFDTDICVNTLYFYIRKGFIGNLSMSSLPLPRKKKNKKERIVAKRPPRGTSIEQRPQEIAERSSFGHWEMDCVCGPTKDCLLVLTERLTRYEIIFKMNEQKARAVVERLDVLEKTYGEKFAKIFKSITVDNGSEFSDFNGLKRSCLYDSDRTQIFYCHPYSAYERGTNERINREIRRLVPKGTSLKPYTDYSVARLARWINSYPRQILGFASSEELFTRLVSTM